MSKLPLRTHALRVVVLACVAVAGFRSPLAAGQQASIAQAIQQLQGGDAFRALLTLNEVVGQPGLDAQTLARAHAVRAMAYLEMKQPERARAAVDLALQANPGFVPAAAEVNSATTALFESARAPVAANPEAAGQAAEQAGQFQQAFLSYLSAYQSLPSPAPQEDDRRLRERIIRVVQKLGTIPIVPQAAQDHARKGDQLIEAEAILGGTPGASSRNAAAAYTEALRIAPWWAEATWKLASVLQKLQRVDEALANLNLYKLADPNGYAAAASPRAAAPTATPVRSAPVTGTGTIVVYRPRAFNSGAVRANVDCNGVRMAELQNGRVVTFKAPAGKQTIKIRGEEEFVVDVQPGGEYYFKNWPGGFGFNARPVSPEEAKAEIKERKLKVNDTKRTMSAECRVASVQPRR
jgi:tetratricopeptide (TPR) repeat protein